MYKPDKVMLEFQRGSSEIDDYHAILAHEPIECHPRVYGDWGGVYLLATSERELASELAGTLWQWLELAERTMEDHVLRFDANRAEDFWQGIRETKTILAKLDKGE